MKGVVLRGGGSSRFPLTKVTNKHLLPGLQQADDLLSRSKPSWNAGITEIMLGPAETAPVIF